MLDSLVQAFANVNSSMVAKVSGCGYSAYLGINTVTQAQKEADDVRAALDGLDSCGDNPVSISTWEVWLRVDHR